MTQLDLFTPMTELTVADIDEWIAVTRSITNAHVASHYPHEWTRVALGALLGEDIPDRRWSTSDLLDMLARARVECVAQRTAPAWAALSAPPEETTP